MNQKIINNVQDQFSDLIPKEFFQKKQDIQYDPFIKYKL